MRKLILLLAISLLAACGGGDDESSTPPPIALAGSVSLDEDSSVTITLSGNPQSGGTLSYSISTQPSNGSLSGSGNSWTYTPNADYAGSDAIRFTVSEGGVRSTPATIEITVNPINDAPMADDIRFELDEDSTVTSNFNVTDVDDDPLNFSIINGPSNGAIEISDDGQFTFSPNPDYSGIDRVTIEVSDNIADALQFLVSFDIAAINDQPTVAASTDLVLLSGMTEFIELESEDVDGDSLTLELFSQPDFVGYERGSQEIMVSLAEGDFPTGTFSYRVKDANLASDLGEINYSTDDRTVSLNTLGASSEPAIHRGIVAIDESFMIATEVISPATETNIQL